MAKKQVTDAKLEGFLWSYTHNGVARNSDDGEMGSHDLAFGDSPTPYINVVLSGGVGDYTVRIVTDGVMRHVASCGPNVSNLKLTPWALQNGWALQGNRIVKIS